MPPSQNLNWDDLRVLFEVARQGSIHGAAKVLGIDHSTVTRRVSQIELQLHRRLFDRSNRGIKVRPEATELLKHIQSMDWHASAASEEMLRDEPGKIKTIRIATMEGIASSFLANRIHLIAEENPNLKIELFSNPHIVDLLKKETDLFISFFNPSRPGLTSQMIGECMVFLYGSEAYEAKYGLPTSRKDMSEHRYVSYIDEMVSIESVRWLYELVDKPSIAFASNSVIAQSNAAVSGVGLVALPAFVGDSFKLLRRVAPKDIRLQRSIWLSVTKDQYYLPSIRSAARTVAKLFAAEQMSRSGEQFINGENQQSAPSSLPKATRQSSTDKPTRKRPAR